MRSRRFTVIAFAAIASCRAPAEPDAHLVAQWMTALRAFEPRDSVTGPDAARISAYTALALYEGYAADPRSRLSSLAGQINALWSVPLPGPDAAIDGATAGAIAARAVVDSLLPAAARSKAYDSLANAQVARRRSSGVSAALSTRSVDHGLALSRVILRWAADDGFAATRGRAWNVPAARGQWTGPSAMEPHWGRLRTFVLRNSDECMPPRPPAYSENRGSDFWKMGREVIDSVASLTPEKRALTLFWADSSAATGLAHWMRIVDQTIRQRSLTADQAVEVYALTAVGIADAMVGSWREKYRSLVVRPETYAQRVFDARWRPVLATPASPEYPAEDAVVAGAAAHVLAELLGDSLTFTDSARANLGLPPRSFRGFTHARDEAVASRIYGGVQFVPSAANGVMQGECIGERVLGRLRTRARST